MPELHNQMQKRGRDRGGGGMKKYSRDLQKLWPLTSRRHTPRHAPDDSTREGDN